MNRYLWLVLVTLLPLVLAGCGTDDGRVTLDGGDAGSTVTIESGEKLRVKLEGNPTTGFEWEVIAVDDAVLRLDDREFDPDSDAEGSGGIVTLDFEALAPGSTLLELIYRPPWEQPDDSHLRYSVTIRVE